MKSQRRTQKTNNDNRTVSMIFTDTQLYPSWLTKKGPRTSLFKRISNLTIKRTTSSQSTDAALVVDKVSIYDIGSVCCIGDSLLTGLGVTSNPTKLKNRVISSLPQLSLLLTWILSGEHRQNNCITGNSILSIARLVKEINGEVGGLSTRKTRLFSKGNGLNFAQTGAKSYNLKSQIINLVHNIPPSPKWKLMFLWIGSNDVFSRSLSALKKGFQRDITESIRLIQENLPNTIVILLPLPSLAHLYSDVSLAKQQSLVIKIETINKILLEISELEWSSSTFKVILHPIPDAIGIEDAFVSSLDNIHPSFVAQQILGKCIWNNLFRSVKVTKVERVLAEEWAQPKFDDYIV